MTDKSVNPAREAAFRSLLKMDAGKYTNIEINTTLNKTSLSDKDKALYTRLVYGVIERIITLDYIIGCYSKNPIDSVSPEALCALRIGLYQLAYMDRVPDHAAVDESVSLVPKRVSGYVNAVLRSFLRDKKEIKYPTDNEKRISIQYSVPVSLVRKLTDVLGSERAEKYFSRTLEEDKITLHVNNLKITQNDFCKKYGTEPHFVKNCVESEQLFGLDTGEAFVQDAASAFAVSLLDARENDIVVDTCAAPGGKSFAAALEMNNKGKIYSFDIHENKFSLIKKESEKLGISIIETAKQDASNPRDELIGKADRVICDAPCSGFGVIRKKPDIKYKDMEQAANLPNVQARILRGASQYLKSGGVLIYSTCTILPEENEDICTAFINENEDFEMYPFEYEGEKHSMLTLLPNDGNMDGFFICRMRKK